MSWSARILVALTLILAGGAAAVWALARYDGAARVLGVAPRVSQSEPTAAPLEAVAQPEPLRAASSPAPPSAPQLASLEARLARVESATQRAEGSAGRADALLVAFAARRAIDRGVQLGYLESLLVDRFAGQHQQAVATVITASRNPVRLEQLVAEYEALAPQLRGGAAGEGWWPRFQRELGTLIEVRRADRPSRNPDARFQRALALLDGGDVDRALVETMRMPGVSNAGAWIAKARRFVAARRALDEIDSAALMAGNAPRS